MQAKMPPGQIRGVKYVSYYDTSGYFHAAKNYMLGLKRYGIPFTWAPIEFRPSPDENLNWRPISGAKTGDAELDPYLNREMNYDRVLVHLTPEKYPWWVEHEPRKIVIGCTVWETTEIPPFWVGAINLLDRVIVPTEWNKRVFERGGITIPIYVVPHIASDTYLSHPRLPKSGHNKDYVFYSIETWTERKALHKLLRCYWETFSAEDPTLLVLKTTLLDETKLVRQRILRSTITRTWLTVKQLQRKYRTPAKIKLITVALTEQEIRQLHATGDCYVSLSHSEGWGLGAYGAAAMGNPVIITGFGGQLDFLPGDMAYLVDFNLVPVEGKKRGENYHPDQKWAQPDLRHAASLMRFVFENQEEAAARGDSLKHYARDNFSEERVMQQFIAAIAGE